LSIVRKLASETAIYGLPTLVGRLANFWLVPLYTKMFLPAEYGVVSTMYAYASFLNVALTYGMETTFFRFTNEHPENDKVYSTAYNSVIITTLLFLFAAFFFKQPIAEWMEIGTHPEYFVWFAIITAFDALVALPFVKLRQMGKAKRYAFVRSVNMFTNIGLNLFFLMLCPYLLKQGWDWIGVIYKPDFGIGYIFISNLIASIITWPLAYPENLQFNFGFDFDLWKRMIIYAWPLLFVGFAGMINETFDRILLGKLLPTDIAEHDIGIYSACYKLSILMSLFIQAYRMAAEPFLFARARNSDAGATYARLMDYFVIVCCVIFLGVTFFLQFFADVFLKNPDYHTGLFIVPILLLANMFLGIYYNLSIWYKLADKNIIGSYISIIAAGLTIAFNFALIPRLGYEGSAWATLAAYFFMAVVSYVWGQKHYPIPYNLNKIYAFILSMAVFYIIYEVARYQNGSVGMALRIVLLLLFGGVVYGIERYKWVKAQ
jgi:O-antigen/teichoic acid export membrane protein